MATVRWLGRAPAIAQVTQITLGGTLAVDDTVVITINQKSVRYRITSATIATEITGLTAALTASTIAEFLEITFTDSSTYVKCTAATAGVPFTLTAAITSTSGTVAVQDGLATPVNSAFTDTATGGTLLANTTYYYRVSAVNAAGETLASTETSKATANDASNTHKITVAWATVVLATSYRIYGRSTGAELYLAEVGSGATSWIDTGALTPAGALPAVNTSIHSSPNDVGLPVNWSTNTTLPAASDTVILENGSSSLKWKLNDLSAVQLTALKILSTFTGEVGLPQDNGSYAEYRPTYWKIRATTIEIGEAGGIGTGSGRIKIDGQSFLTGITVYGTATGLESGLEAFLFIGTHASNTLEVYKGSVGLARLYGESCTILTMTVGYTSNVSGDALVKAGTGLTLTTLNQSGGTVVLNSGLTTVTKTDGTLTVNAGNITTLTVDGGKAWYNGTGTITTLNVSDGGEANFTQDMSARTLTNTNLYKGCRLTDSFKTVTFTNAFALVRCELADIHLDLGTNFSLQRS